MKMIIVQKIENYLAGLPEGQTFGYQNLPVERGELVAAAKAMERLVQKKVVQRLVKGVFFKPKSTVFGFLKPAESEILKQYLFKNEQRIAYITGIGLYQQMGLTTQIPQRITIAAPKRRKPVMIEHLWVQIIKSDAEITEENYMLLGILDALKDFNAIPDADTTSNLQLLNHQLQLLTTPRLQLLVECALKYPPRVRALLGALLETVQPEVQWCFLKQSLNPLSRYTLKIPHNILPNANFWQFKLFVKKS